VAARCGKAAKNRLAVRDLSRIALAEGGYKCAMTRSPSSLGVVAAIAAVSAAALGTAFVAQYGFDLRPCELCVLQRLPYAFTLLFGLMATLPAVPPEARRQVAALCAALFAVNAGIALYHTGVEYHWWQGPTACTGHLQNFSMDDLAAALTHPAAVQCDQAAVRVLGVSMAGANAIACAVFALLCAGAAAREDVWSVP
jgi:disulfide bond formation protein DsbB